MGERKYRSYKDEVRGAIKDVEDGVFDPVESRSQLREAVGELIRYENECVEADSLWVADAESDELKKMATTLLRKPVKNRRKNYRTLKIDVCWRLFHDLRILGNSISERCFDGEPVSVEKAALFQLAEQTFCSSIRRRVLNYPLFAKVVKTRYGFEDHQDIDMSVKGKAIRLYASALEGLELCLPERDDENADNVALRPLAKACQQLMQVAETYFDRKEVLDEDMQDTAQRLRVKARKYLKD